MTSADGFQSPNNKDSFTLIISKATAKIDTTFAPYDDICYTNKNGNRFAFTTDFPDQNSYSDTFSIKITQWDGPNGFAYGEITADLTLNTGEKVTFRNGVFKIKIQGDSGF